MSKANATIPCQYKTGKTLGSGTYAVVKEAVHVKTGKFYACKVISKKLMEGREYMVRNEIAVLKKVSAGHSNIVTLYDYFETANNLYLVFDLCTGGELFDRICAKGSYYEEDAAAIVRTVLGAVKYIHESGIVHRDLKPENLLFRTKAEDAELLIADFGLSRVVDDSKHIMLTEVCGTPGYMAPEIFKKIGHGKPVDIWAVGVIAYFLLCGYTPFDRESQQEEMDAICAGDYKFEPAQYWEGVSDTARDFVRSCLTVDQRKRPNADEALAHPWLSATTPHFVPDPESAEGRPTNLLPGMLKAFDARKTFRKAVLSMMAVRRLSLNPTTHPLAKEVEGYKETAENENMGETLEVTFQHEGSDPTPPGSPTPGTAPPKSPLPPKSPALAPAGGDKEQEILAPKKPESGSNSNLLDGPKLASSASSASMERNKSTGSDSGSHHGRSRKDWWRFGR